MKRSELEDAIDYYLGDDINNALIDANINLPQRLDMAIIKAFLVLCDAASRLLFPVFTTETPVGVVTAFIGGPLFVYLLRKSSTSEMAVP